MARAPRPGRCKTRLEPRLGPEGCARLQAALVRGTVAWALAAGAGEVWLAHDPADASDELRALAGDGVRLVAQEGADLGQRLTAACAHAFAESGGPLLVVGTDCPALAPGSGHAAAAREDLEAGCDAVFGPALDGGYYLVAMARPEPGLFALPAERWGGTQVLALSLQQAGLADLAVGLLRTERDLDTPEDAAVMAADPLVPAGLRALLTTA